ncbi:unnamed protein product [Lupinus luteus]|uniref:Uncharacterized protein n=1 Tax=Lupinus luteus TaxID=3873 RepID=A0AAV1VR75_LUPLU
MGLEELNHTGAWESETFLQKAIQKQGRATIMDTIQERHDTVKDIELNLNALKKHQKVPGGGPA